MRNKVSINCEPRVERKWRINNATSPNTKQKRENPLAPKAKRGDKPERAWLTIARNTRLIFAAQRARSVVFPSLAQTLVENKREEKFLYRESSQELQRIALFHRNVHWVTRRRPPEEKISLTRSAILRLVRDRPPNATCLMSANYNSGYKRYELSARFGESRIPGRCAKSGRLRSARQVHRHVEILSFARKKLRFVVLRRCVRRELITLPPSVHTANGSLSIIHRYGRTGATLMRAEARERARCTRIRQRHRGNEATPDCAEFAGRR